MIKGKLSDYKSPLTLPGQPTCRAKHPAVVAMIPSPFKFGPKVNRRFRQNACEKINRAAPSAHGGDDEKLGAVGDFRFEALGEPDAFVADENNLLADFVPPSSAAGTRPSLCPPAGRRRRPSQKHDVERAYVFTSTQISNQRVRGRIFYSPLRCRDAPAARLLRRAAGVSLHGNCFLTTTPAPAPSSVPPRRKQSPRRANR